MFGRCEVVVDVALIATIRSCHRESCGGENLFYAARYKRDRRRRIFDVLLCEHCGEALCWDDGKPTYGKRALSAVVDWKVPSLVHLIAYDLMSPGQDYPHLEETIQGLGEAHRVLESVWIVESRLATGTIHGRLRTAVDANDRLLVTRLTADTEITLHDEELETVVRGVLSKRGNETYVL